MLRSSLSISPDSPAQGFKNDRFYCLQQEFDACEMRGKLLEALKQPDLKQQIRFIISMLSTDSF